MQERLWGEALLTGAVRDDGAARVRTGRGSRCALGRGERRPAWVYKRGGRGQGDTRGTDNKRTTFPFSQTPRPLSTIDPRVSPVADAPTAFMRPSGGSAPRGTNLWWSMPPGPARRRTMSNDPSWAPSRAPSDDELAQLPTDWSAGGVPVARLVLTTTDGGTGVDAVTWRRAWFLLISRPDDDDRVAIRTALKRSRELMAS